MSQCLWCDSDKPERQEGRQTLGNHHAADCPKYRPNLIWVLPDGPISPSPKHHPPLDDVKNAMGNMAEDIIGRYNISRMPEYRKSGSEIASMLSALSLYFQARTGTTKK